VTPWQCLNDLTRLISAVTLAVCVWAFLSARDMPFFALIGAGFIVSVWVVTDYWIWRLRDARKTALERADGR
jgi:hypothetical protein